MSTPCSIFITADSEDLVTATQESLSPLQTEVLIVPGYPSISKAFNSVISSAANEIVILCSHRCRPTEDDIERLVDLLNQGFGIVGLYNMEFFGFKKELLRRVGVFDERFFGDGFFDSDLMFKTIEANIAVYEDTSVDYVYSPINSDYSRSNPFFVEKWSRDTEAGTIHRNLAEETYTYDLGEDDPTLVFKPRDESVSTVSADTQTFCRSIQFV